TVRGLAIDRFRGAGIVSQANQVVIAGNFLGTNPAGAAGLGNTTGVLLQAGASGNTIGGTSLADANLITNSAGGAAFITGGGTTGNVVEGNFIGTDQAGRAGLGNGVDGVEIAAGASGNTIGGTTPGAANVIAGNASEGVLIDGGAANNFVEGN